MVPELHLSATQMTVDPPGIAASGRALVSFLHQILTLGERKE